MTEKILHIYEHKDVDIDDVVTEFSRLNGRCITQMKAEEQYFRVVFQFLSYCTR